MIESLNEDIELNKWNYLEWNNYKLSGVNFLNFSEREYDFVDLEELDIILNGFIKKVKFILKKVKLLIEKKYGV